MYNKNSIKNKKNLNCFRELRNIIFKRSTQTPFDDCYQKYEMKTENNNHKFISLFFVSVLYSNSNTPMLTNNNVCLSKCILYIYMCGCVD